MNYTRRMIGIDVDNHRENVMTLDGDVVLLCYECNIVNSFYSL
jgi:hypothetical protein